MSKYASGANIEREIKTFLENENYSVVRSAGSKGCIDIVAYNDKVFRLIQVKYVKDKKHMKVTKKEYARLKKNIIPPCATKEIWFRVKKVKGYTIFYVQ